MRFAFTAMLLALSSIAHAVDAPRFPDVAVQTEAGLVPLPIESTRYHVTISAGTAHVRVAQVWRSPFRQAVEARYLGALPPRALLTGLELRVGDRRAVGVLVPAGIAWQRYEAARDRGTVAAIAGGNASVYQQIISDVRPGDRVEVVLEYAQPLEPSPDGDELVLPLVAAPARQGAPGETPRLPEAIHWVHRAHVDVHIDDPGASVRSPSHALVLTRSARGVDATLREDILADRDFVLRLAHGDAPLALSAHIGADRLAWLRLPARPPLPKRHDIVLVLDGAGLEHLAAAVARDLPPTVRVWLVRSARAKGPLRPSAVADALREPVVTRPLPALIATALETAAASRDVVVLGEGNVPDADALVPLLRTTETRVSFVGTGAAPDRAVLARLARAGNGASDVVRADEPGAAARIAALTAIAYEAPRVTCGGRVLTDVEAPGMPAVVGASMPLDAVARVHECEGAFGLRVRRDAIDEDVALPSATLPATSVRATELAWAAARLADLDGKGAAARDEATRVATDAKVAAAGMRLVAEDRASGAVATRLVAAPLPMPFEPPSSDPRGALSTDRIRPGDPEVQIDAPPETRHVTLLLPDGVLTSCALDRRTGKWVGNFLVAEDRPEGVDTIHVVIELADGKRLRRSLRFQVDATAPDFELELDPAHAHPGDAVELRVAPRLQRLGEELDAASDDIGDGTFATRMREDLDAVVVAWTDGTLRALKRDPDGVFRVSLRAPLQLGRYQIAVSARDAARNLRRVVRNLEVR